MGADDYREQPKFVEPRVSLRQMTEFMAWFEDNYQSTHEDGVYMSIHNYGETYTREQIVQEFITKFNIV